MRREMAAQSGKASLRSRKRTGLGGRRPSKVGPVRSITLNRLISPGNRASRGVLGPRSSSRGRGDRAEDDTGADHPQQDRAKALRGRAATRLDPRMTSDASDDLIGTTIFKSAIITPKFFRVADA